MFTRRERHKSARSLVCLLQALAGRRTRLELRNELSVTGTIHCVDCNMNITLKNAETEKLNGEKEAFDEMSVRGCQLRYVHIPDDVDVMATIEKQVCALLPEVSGGDKRKRLSRARAARLAEEKRAASLGRGRGGGGGGVRGGGGGRGRGGGGGGGVQKVGGEKSGKGELTL